MKPRPLIDELLDEHLPKRYYGHEARKHAKNFALEFFQSARQEFAMQEEIDMEILFGRGLLNEERNDILKKWGYPRQYNNKP
jgi:hypothetical protein